ncbi:uncharacterized protein LOC116095645 [Mastomys coucha]|uniref:uncharacterized protein LOC116095645 n=1 Tax=Mastomys coucha TaxID=35658 RepID=UPI001261E9DF|nr:uncharacterized protein LOC116095645 [Mastomys coucha]
MEAEAPGRGAPMDRTQRGGRDAGLGGPGASGGVARARAPFPAAREGEGRMDSVGRNSGRGDGSPLRGPPGCHFVLRPPFRAARGRGRGAARGRRGAALVPLFFAWGPGTSRARPPARYRSV